VITWQHAWSEQTFSSAGITISQRRNHDIAAGTLKCLYCSELVFRETLNLNRGGSRHETCIQMMNEQDEFSDDDNAGLSRGISAHHNL